MTIRAAVPIAPIWRRVLIWGWLISFLYETKGVLIRIVRLGDHADAGLILSANAILLSLGPVVALGVPESL